MNWYPASGFPGYEVLVPRRGQVRVRNTNGYELHVTQRGHVRLSRDGVSHRVNVSDLLRGYDEPEAVALPTEHVPGGHAASMADLEARIAEARAARDEAPAKLGRVQRTAGVAAQRHAARVVELRELRRLHGVNAGLLAQANAEASLLRQRLLDAIAEGDAARAEAAELAAHLREGQDQAVRDMARMEAVFAELDFTRVRLPELTAEVERLTAELLVTARIIRPAPAAASQEEEWRPTARFPGYEINRAGQVRHAETLKVCTPRYREGRAYHEIRAAGQEHRVAQVNSLLEEAFGPGAAEAAGFSKPRPWGTPLAKHKPKGRVEAEPKAAFGLRRCHDCGCETPNYRCDDCWKRIRGAATA